MPQVRLCIQRWEDGQPSAGMIRLRHNSAINPRQNGMSLDDEPCPTVMTGGLSAFGDYWIEIDYTPPHET